ncbi:MAG: hypothetical protein IH806_07605 [Proteobacteria bacterium]|nr:hypothetical protein [Pseudomonadota bacterium]
MTPEMGQVLGILFIAFVLLVTELVRMDVVALMVLGALALTGLVTDTQALSGFSSPAVVTVWAVFILSGGLTRTGVANILGDQVFKLAGDSELRMIAVIMLTAGIMSAFLNNVGVAALLLPVIMDLARRTGTAPSRLLMPLALTSTKGMIKRLGAKRWINLHKLIYVAGILACFHFYMMRKGVQLEPIIYAGICALLLGYRVVAFWKRKAGARAA